MAEPIAAALLEAWERGLRLPLPRRVLLLLAAVDGRATLDQLADLTIGQRDARLLRLREQLFGPRLSILAGCPACSAPLEADFGVADVLQTVGTDAASVHEATIAGYRLVFRLPTSRDLIDLTELERVQRAQLALLSICLIESASPCGEAVDAAGLPEPVIGELEQRMAAADPQAEVILNFTCPECAHRWGALFDIASFVWREVHAWAQCLIGDVHRLARAYGWREAEILAMTPFRRQMYLELVDAG